MVTRPLRWVALAAVLTLDWATAPCRAQAGAAAAEVVFALGTPDQSYAEFALAAEGHNAFTRAFPGEIVVKAQDAEALTTFPFIQPSTADAWAGGRAHPIRVLFGLPQAPQGTYRLTLWFAATHWGGPPLLVVGLNGVSRLSPLPAAAPDDSVLRSPQTGQQVMRSFSFPAGVLRQGENELLLQTVDGSWVLYDALRLERTDAPAEPGQAAVLSLGSHDNSYRDFALAQEGYGAFAQRFPETVVYRVGQDTPPTAFPYIHPGPTDAWAGSRPHPIRLEFELAEEAAGDACLVLDLVAAHGTAPPRLECDLNGSRSARRTVAGPGDAVLGDPARGAEQFVAFRLPAWSLRRGLNQLTLTAQEGSWVLYDALDLFILDGEKRPESLRLLGLEGSGLLRRDAGGGRMGWLQCDYWGRAVEAEVTVTCGQETLTQRLPALPLGLSRQAVRLPPGDGTVPTSARLVAGTLEAQASASLGRPPPRTLYVVPSIHTDIGYTHVQAECARRHVDSLVNILRACDDTRDYPAGSALKWNCEVTWEVEQFLALAPDAAPHLFELCRQGRIDISAAYANLLTGLMGGEQSCRLVYLAQRLRREQGLALESATMTDVPSHAWWVPSVLADSGVRYFAIGCNDARGAFASGNPLRPPLWWEGPDGRKVLFFFAGGYAQASGLGLFESLEVAEARVPDRLRGAWPEERYPYELVMAYGAMGDNQTVSYDEARRLADIVRAWNERYESPRLVLATTSDFFRDFAARYGEGLATCRGDAGAYWEDGAASSARETALNRETHEWLSTAEKLHAWLATIDPKRAYPAERLWQVARDSMLYDEHTWGAYNSITEPASPFVQEQWTVKAGFATGAHASAAVLVAEGLQELAQHAGGLPQGGLLVYNPLSWGRSELAFVAVGEAPFAVMDLATGKPVPQQLVERQGRRELAFFAADVPGLGCRRFGRLPIEGWPALPTVTRSTEAVEVAAGRYRLRLVPERGGLASLVDTPSGRDLIDAGSPFALGQWLYDLGGTAPNRETLVKRTTAVGTEVSYTADAPVFGQARMAVELAPLGPAELVVTWSPLMPGLGLEVSAQKRETTDPESVFVAFPLAVPGGTIRYETGFALAQVETDQLPNGCRDWYAVNQVVDVAGDQSGITWATRDAFLVEFGDIQTGRWLRQLPVLNQTLFANVMNNLWFTNYKASQGGDLRFRFGLLPRTGGFDRAAAIRFGYETATPLLVTDLPARPAAATAAEVASGFLSVADRGVMVLAAKRPEHGEGLIVRLQELTGMARECALALPRPVRQAELCNLVEEPRERLACAGTTCQVPLPAGGLATVRLLLE
jgi:hypothetical protein